MASSGRTLLVVHAHPDDESITMGGTLARYAAEGVRTVLVTCTLGDLGIHDESLRGQDVPALRARELEQAARVLGISRVVQLGYLDSGMAGDQANQREGAFAAGDLTEAADKLGRIIDEERPQVVVTYDETGGYGHPDHVKTHHVTVAAFHASGMVQPAKLYYIRFPLEWSRKFVRALRHAGIDAPLTAVAGADAGPDAPEIGVLDSLVTTKIATAAYVETKLAALACHPSQMPPDHFLRRMPLQLARELWAYEYYSREAGPTTQREGELEADLFAGVS